jgi:hypothetical protein
MIPHVFTHQGAPWYGDFGVFKKGKDRSFRADLDPDIIKALGLAMP